MDAHLSQPRTASLAEAVRALGSSLIRVATHMRAASGVNDTDFVALTLLADEPGLTAGALAQRLQRSPAATSAVVDRLEDAGHVVRRRGSADRRQVTLWPTERPAAVALATLEPLLAQLELEFRADDADRIADATTTVHRVNRAVSAFLGTIEHAADDDAADDGPV